MINNHVILLHGALGASADLVVLEKHLRLEGLQPHLFEFSGHGKQRFADDFGINQFSSELAGFIKNNNLQGAAIFGYSMGGYVALHRASLEDDLIGPIVTLGTKLNWTAEIIKQESGFCNLTFLSQKAPAFVAGLEAKHSDHLQLLIKTAEMILAFENHDLLRPDWTPKQKIILGIGDRDKLVTLDECRQFIKERKSGGLFMLPFAGHPLDQADHLLLAKIITRFLEKA